MLAARKLIPLLCLFLPVALQAAPMPTPNAPPVSAKSYILVDYDSQRILAEQNADERVEPASLTKMMTAYVVDVALRDGDISLQDMVTISEKAWRTGGSRMFIEVGKQVSLEDLLKGLIIQSGNDAAVALAEYVAGSEASFAALMNHQAKLLGLSNTHYVNATGLPHEDHYTSARDMALLSRAIIRDFPQQYELYAVKSFTFNGITQHNRNQLLYRDESVDGLKTGHTEAAGYCLAASARRNDQRLISVVMGSPNEKGRVSASQALLGYGFRFFTTHRLYGAGEPITRTRVWKGTAEDVGLGLEKDLYVTIPRGRYDELQANMRLNQAIEAPISAGSELGHVEVSLDGNTVTTAPLLALQDVPEAGLMGRLSDEAVLLFKSMFDE